MTITIHKNYGCLAAEKRCVYTHKVPAETAVTYERLVVETPDGWDAYETPAEDIVLTPPDGIPSPAARDPLRRRVPLRTPHRQGRLQLSSPPPRRGR